MRNTYGKKVEVKYVDTDKTGFDDYPLIRRVLQVGYTFPITLINGEPKFAGGIMEREINKIVGELIK